MRNKMKQNDALQIHSTSMLYPLDQFHIHQKIFLKNIYKKRRKSGMHNVLKNLLMLKITNNFIKEENKLKSWR